MAFNLGILGQVLTPAMAGLQRGSAMAEAEAYKRQREEEEARRAASMQALQEQLLRSREAREAEMHPLQMQLEKARTLSALPTFAEPPEQLPGGSPSALEQLEMDEIRSRIAENNAQASYYGRMPRETGGRGASPEEPDTARREYLAKRIPELQKPRNQKNEFGEETTVPGMSTADAYRHASEEWQMMSGGAPGAPTAQDRIKSYIRGRNGVEGSSVAGDQGISLDEDEPETAAPSTETTGTGDGKIRLGDPMQQRAAKQRWDELVNGGLDPDSATQQVLREFSR